jgi:hypothetical protein
MALTVEQLSQALSNLALIQDDHPIHTSGITNKAEHFTALLAESQSQEAFYMLATYCFDVSKRFAILHALIADVCAASATPSAGLAADVLADTADLNAADKTWEERAYIAAGQLNYWHNRANSTNADYRINAG